MAKNTAEKLRADAEKEFAQIGREMAQWSEADDEQFPPDYRVKRSQERARLRKAWQMVENRVLADAEAWAQSEQQAAAALYESDPVGTAADESRRVADNLEIAQVATPYIGQPTMARNRLLPEVRRYIALGAVDKARVYLEAARRAGVTDGRLDKALSDALDQTVPHRKKAREQESRAGLEVDLTRLHVVQQRIAHKVGTRSEQAVDSGVAKFKEWRMKEGMNIALEGGEPVPDGGSSADASEK